MSAFEFVDAEVAAAVVAPVALAAVEARMTALLAACFEYGDPACLDIADYAFHRIVEKVLPVLKPIFDADAAHAVDWSTMSSSPCPLLRTLEYLHTKKPVVSMFFDFNSALWDGLIRGLDSPHWEVITAWLSLSSWGVVLRPPPKKALDDIEILWESIFDQQQDPRGFELTPTARAHQWMYRARALGLWDFRIDHPSVAMGLNSAFAASDEDDIGAIGSVDLCFSDATARSASLAIAQFDTLLALLVQHSSCQEGLRRPALVMSVSATMELVQWLSPRFSTTTFAPGTPAQQKFHFFMRNADKAADWLVLLPFLDGGHFVLGALWWEAGAILNVAYLDSNWPGAEGRHFAHYTNFFRPFVTMLRDGFGVQLAPEPAFLTFPRDRVFVQTGNSCGHLVLWFISALLEGKRNRAPRLVLEKFIADAAINPGPDALETGRTAWADATIVKGVEWAGRVIFLEVLESLRLSGEVSEWPHGRLLQTPMELIEYCAAASAAEVSSYLSDQSVLKYLTGTVPDEWTMPVPPGKGELILPWLPSPSGLAAVLQWVSVAFPESDTDPGPEFQLIRDPLEREPTWGKTEQSTVFDGVQESFKTFATTAIPRLVASGVSHAATTGLEHFKAISKIVPLLGGLMPFRFTMDLDKWLSGVIQSSDTAGLVNLRRHFAAAQTPVDVDLPADTAWRFASENVLSTLWPKQFCWLGPADEAGFWYPTHWLGPHSDGKFPPEALAVVAGLADVWNVQPYANQWNATGPVVRSPKPFLDTKAKFLRHFETEVTTTPTLKLVGSALAMPPGTWTEEELLAICGRVVFEMVMQKNDGAYLSNGVTEKALADTGAVLSNVPRFFKLLKKAEEGQQLMDPRLIWLAHQLSEDTRDIATRVGNRFVQIASFLGGISETTDKWTARFERGRTIEVNIATKLEQLDDLPPYAFARKSALLGELIDLRAAAVEFQNGELLDEDVLLEMVPESWRRRLPTLKALNGIQRAHTELSGRLAALLSSLTDLRAEWTTIAAKYDVLRMSAEWQAFFALGPDELSLEEGSAAIAVLERMPYWDFEKSPFATRDARGNALATFALKYRSHLTLLDAVEGILDAADLSLAEAEDLGDVADRREVDVVSAILALAQNAFADAGKYAELLERAQHSDVLNCILGVMHHLFAPDTDSQHQIFGVTDLTWSATRSRLGQWAARLDESITILTDAATRVEESGAFQKARRWFKGRMQTMLAALKEDQPAAQQRDLSRIAIVRDFLLTLTPVDNFDNFLAISIPDERSRRQFARGVKQLIKGKDAIPKFDTDDEAASLLETLGDMHDILDDLFHPELAPMQNHGETLAVKRAGFQRFVLVTDKDLKKALDGFARKQQDWFLNDKMVSSGIFQRFAIGILHAWTIVFDPDNPDSPVVELLARDPNIFQRIIGKGLRKRAKQTLGFLDTIMHELEFADGAFDLLLTHFVNTRGALARALQDVPVSTGGGGGARTISVGSAADFERIVKEHNDGIGIFRHKEIVGTRAAGFWVGRFLELFPPDEAREKRFVQTLTAAVELFSSFKTTWDERRDDVEREYFYNRVIKIVLPKPPDTWDFAAIVGTLPVAHATMANAEPKDLPIFSTTLNYFAYPLIPFLPPVISTTVVADLAELREIKADFALKSFGSLRLMVGQLLEGGALDLPRAVAHAATKRPAWTSTVDETVDFLEHLPFAMARPGELGAAEFFAAMSELFSFTSPASQAQLAIDLAFARLAAGHRGDIIRSSLADTIRMGPGAFFADPEAEGYLMTGALHREISDWVDAALRECADHASLVISERTEALGELRALLRYREVARDLPGGQKLRLRLPFRLRARGYREMVEAGASQTFMQRTKFYENLLVLMHAILTMSGLDDINARHTSFREITSRAIALYEQALADPLRDEEKSWPADDGLDEIDLKSLTAYARAVAQAGDDFEDAWEAFRLKTGPLSRHTYAAYAGEVGAGRDRLSRADFGVAPTFLLKQLYLVKGDRPIRTAEDERELAADVDKAVDAVADALEGVAQKLRAVEQQLATIVREMGAAKLAAQSELEAAIKWTSSRFHRPEYEDLGDQTRPAWLVADEKTPGAQDTWAMFSVGPKTGRDDRLATTTFTPAHRAALEKAERARLEPFLQLEAEWARQKQLYDIEQQERRELQQKKKKK